MHSDEAIASGGCSAEFRRRHLPVESKGHSYREFSRWLDGQLELLVAQWIATAAPASREVRRSGR